MSVLLIGDFGNRTLFGVVGSGVRCRGLSFRGRGGYGERLSIPSSVGGELRSCRLCSVAFKRGGLDSCSRKCGLISCFGCVVGEVLPMGLHRGVRKVVG